MNKRPFPFKPMTVGNILDYSFRVYRDNFVTIMGFSALVSGGFSLLILLLQSLAAPSGTMTDPWGLIINGIKSGDFPYFIQQIPQSEPGPGYFPESLLFFIVSYASGLIMHILVNPFVQGGITNITARYFHGFSMDLSAAFKQTTNKFGKLVLTALSLMVYYIGIAIGGVVLLGIIVAVLFALSAAHVFLDSAGGTAILVVGIIFVYLILVGAFFVMFNFVSFTYQAAVCEGKYNFAAIGRSFKLVGKKFWKVVGVRILMYLLVYAIIGAIGGVAFLIALLSPVDIMFQEVITLIITALATPLIYIATTILYYDCRIRLEGYDLEVMSREEARDDQWQLSQS